MALRFGTDGVRAEAFTQLTTEYARALGAAAARVLDGDSMLIGRDTRESGPALQRAFAQGCALEGVAVVDLGIVPTPAVAHMSTVEGVPGAMLSASHNPWRDNGIKLFAAGGLKLRDDDQDVIQSELDRRPALDDPGTEPSVHSAAIDPYLDAVVASIDGRDFAGTTVALDAAHGAASTTGAVIFERLGAEVIALADQPDGRNINNRVGSMHPEFLRAQLEASDADVGFAFDGDADRIVAVGRDGSLIDGDRIIAMTAVDRRDRGRLAHDTVVITVMANLGFRHAMMQAGIGMVETGVGDRYVLEALDAGGYSLGGEQSGHVIHRDLATTGDGVLTAVQLLDAAVRRNGPRTELDAWAADVMVSFPQVLKNVRTAAKIPDLAERLSPAIEAEERQLGSDGRILIRESGTEPVVRVMVEAATDAAAEESASRLVAAVEMLT